MNREIAKALILGINTTIIISAVIFFASALFLEKYMKIRSDFLIIGPTVASILSAFITLIFTLKKIKSGTISKVQEKRNEKNEIRKTPSSNPSDEIYAIKNVRDNIEANIDSKQAENSSITEQGHEGCGRRLMIQKIMSLSGKMRLYIALSIAWIVIIGVNVNENNWNFEVDKFIYWGILPVLTVWIYFWVRKGLKDDKNKRE